VPDAPRVVVERYIDRLVAHDWEAMADCLAENIVRVGPFGDRYTPRGPYVAFLADLMPSLPGYAMRVDRIVEAGRTAVVELTETVEMNGAPLDTPEALVFDFDDSGRIAHIAIYIQTLGPVPAVP
jgi:ketosteroid isomerase-like protein